MALEYVSIDDFAGAEKKIAVRDLGSSIKAQLFVPYQENRQDTFTAAGLGTSVNVSEVPCNRFALQVKGTGAVPTSWEVVVEGSLNGSQYTTIATHKSGIDADGAVRWQSQATPSKYFRSQVVSLVLGSATNIVVDILGEAGA